MLRCVCSQKTGEVTRSMGDLRVLIPLGEESQLKVVLNSALCSLPSAQRTELRPHVCLNQADSLEVLIRILESPESANTQICLYTVIIVDGEDIWLNVSLAYMLGTVTWDPKKCLCLTPQQSSYLIKNLPTEFRDQVIEKMKAWYFGTVLQGMFEGLAKIAAQFETGDPLLESDHDNHIFDLHGGRAFPDIYYTESLIAGRELFDTVLYGGTFLEFGDDGFEKADALILARRERQKTAVEAFLGALRGK